jgi:hypothetical protein
VSDPDSPRYYVATAMSSHARAKTIRGEGCTPRQAVESLVHQYAALTPSKRRAFSTVNVVRASLIRTDAGHALVQVTMRAPSVRLLISEAVLPGAVEKHTETL